jgi:tRNA pseudouridine(54/55) synthase
MKLLAAIRVAMTPYGEARSNLLSRKTSPPIINLPGDLAYRFKVQSENCASKVPVQDFVQEVKQQARNVLLSCMDDLAAEYAEDESYPSCIEDEELGYLACYVVAIPSSGVLRPLATIPVRRGGRKGRRHMQEESQGGDPRHNLEQRLEQGGAVLWTLNNALDFVNRDFTTPDEATISQLSTTAGNGVALDFHVAVWRRPFYLKGMYTKTRRDVSQTPFHVVDEGKRRKLGATSVEEEITPAIVRACHGISSLNNGSSKLLFGMAKFHASGREDMDVRMLLPEVGVAEDQAKAMITGRPFVYEIFDAFRLPSRKALETIVNEINNFTAQDSAPHPRSYGRNPSGVGIAADLSFAPSASFKRLQEETEDKVKHYGCLCWSEKSVPSTNEELLRQLGTFPLELHQKTPIRVLHRRANTVRTRHVLSCRAQRMDDHHFRLNISTSAGTYVKEFVHGDLGRTVPSVSTLLDCNTDILELDCEGIQY